MENLEKLDAVIEPILQAARIPGAGIGVVTGGAVFTRSFGLRDLAARLPIDAQTVYPIASTTKAINATLLGLLVDEGRVAWDTPVQEYLPGFRLHDPVVSSQVTVRDLITMRTGLPRHDWCRMEDPMTRGELVERLRYLELSAGFRERFQYTSLTVTTAGHVAEVVTGKRWEDLIREKILLPLGMTSTGFTAPDTGNVTLSYHENSRRELKLSQRLSAEVTAPAGSTMHSSIADMARWISFNLNRGQVQGRPLINSKTLAEIHRPQIVLAPTDAPELFANASYAMGWFVDTYNGHARVSHGGYFQDVNSDVSLFPADDIGIVSFTNFGFPTLAKTVNQYVFDLIMGMTPARKVEEKLAQYERMVGECQSRNALVRRIEGTSPSHALDEYAGVYAHPGYGKIEIGRRSADLIFMRGNLVLPLQHWHYDAWVVKDGGPFFIHVPHAFDPSSRLLFETDADGEISAVSIRFEPAASPIRFARQPGPK